MCFPILEDDNKEHSILTLSRLTPMSLVSQVFKFSNLVHLFSDVGYINNVVSLGCSLWSKKQIHIIRDSISDKNGKAFILDDPNPIKGKDRALAFCKKKNIEYDLISKKPYKEFIKTLALYDKLVFFPSTLESFCRLALESKMLGCKLVTNNFNGCTYEEWFSQYQGKEMINFVDSQRDIVVEKVLKFL